MNDQLLLGIIIGLFFGASVGFAIGFFIARRTRSSSARVEAIRLLSFLVFFGYILISFYYGKEPQWLIVTAILATGYGAKGGEIIEKALEKGEGLIKK